MKSAALLSTSLFVIVTIFALVEGLFRGENDQDLNRQTLMTLVIIYSILWLSPSLTFLTLTILFG